MSRPDTGGREHYRWTGRIAPAPGVRQFDGGVRLYGGHPRKLLSLSPTGAALVRRWFRGEAISPPGWSQRNGAQRLAGRLVAGGLAEPQRPDTGWIEADVVIPVRDDSEGLARTLRSLAMGRVRPTSITVVDDASAIPVVAGPPYERIDWDLEVLRLPRNVGPGPARNVGIASGSSPVVIVIDAGVTFDAEAIEELARWFTMGEQPAAVAPRVRSPAGPGRVARYEAGNSALDMSLRTGRDRRRPELVGLGRPISYVPSTFLALRRTALDLSRSEGTNGASGPFADLRFGEDVDLVWRLARENAVIFDPGITAFHPPRSTVLAFARQRFHYGTSAAALAHRHSEAVTPYRTRAILVPAIAGLVIGRWTSIALAAIVVGIDAWQGYRTLARVSRGSSAIATLGTLESLRTTRASAVGLVDTAGRAWWPLTAAAALQPFFPRVRRRAQFVVLAWAQRCVRRTEIASIEMAMLDDLAYGSGVWWGSLTTGQVGALLPRFSRSVRR